MDYGAIADGETDSTLAFDHVWSEACASNESSILRVPEGTFYVGPLVFKRPCKNPIVFELKGSIVATGELSLFKTTEWVAFHYIDGLPVTGGGKFDGQGALSWRQKAKNGNHLPTSINLSFVTNATIENISSVNSIYFHIHVFASNNVKLQSLKLSAPADSPNTDGIHLGDSKNIEIINTVIETGDDCISVGPGDKNISISNVFCGPGHGISVGSLGASPNEGEVTDLGVTNFTLTNTINGVRIKPWETFPGSSASNMVTEDIVMRQVHNPIIIDQMYCPGKKCR